MAINVTQCWGIVRDGVVVFEPGSMIPEGTKVRLLPEITSIPLPAEWVEETAAWEQLSDQAIQISDLKR